MFKSTNLRLAYPRTEYRCDERTLEHHNIKFFHVEDDPHYRQEYDATIMVRDGDYVVYGTNFLPRTFSNLDACLHYVVGGDFSNWRDNWRSCGIPVNDN